MSGYIKVNTLRNEMYHEAFETDTEMQRWDSGCWIRYKLFENILDQLPTADVVEVVRCKECRYWDNRFDVMVCNLTDGMKGASDYCSYGERREDERLNKQTGCD